MIILCATGALCLGFLLDLAFGDPRGMPHIIRLFGRLIERLERLLRKEGRERAGGVCLVWIAVIVCGGIPAVLLFFAYSVSLWAGFALESVLCFQLLAAGSLRSESGKVLESLARDDLEAARRNLSMIVGRDTAGLDRPGIASAAVETVAENASDGVIAPLFYMTFGGAALGCVYKAANTMDSMVGYKNETYLLFGRAAARFDDWLNFVPSRLAALLMIAGARLCGFDAKAAYRVWRRDRGNHASPNAAQTESVCAGALGVQLGGPARYFGKQVEKPTIGDAKRPVQGSDIAGANRLMYTSAALMILFSILVRGGLYAIL